MLLALDGRILDFIVSGERAARGGRPLDERGGHRALIPRSVAIPYATAIVVLVVVASIFVSRNAAALGGTAFVGVLVGFAAQRFLMDIVAGVLIVFERWYAVGDLGVALLNATKSIKLDGFDDPDERTGAQIIVRALEEPLRQLAYNAGLEGSVVVDKVRRAAKGQGLNVDTNEVEDLVKAGIIDPTMVTRSALRNAASIAKSILMTEAIVAEPPEKAGAGIAGGMGGMGDMGGMMQGKRVGKRSGQCKLEGRPEGRPSACPHPSRRVCRSPTERLHGRVAGGRCFCARVAARASEAFLRSRPRFRKPSRLQCRWSQQRWRGLAWRSGFSANLTTPEVAVGG
jgi:TCP-1/cpn60 chaperonin family/Mechanosensitive ion channel